MNFLSWGSQRSPLCRSKRAASSPSTPPEGGELSAQGCQASHTGRPRRFSRPRRFAPHHTCRSIAPCYRLWGSPRFRVSPLTLSDASIGLCLRLHPFPVAPDPSKCSPRQQHQSRHRDRLPSRYSSLLRFPLLDASAVLWFPPRASQPQGFAPLPSPLQSADVAVNTLPVTPMGFKPSRLCTSEEVTHDVGRLQLPLGAHK